MSDDAAEAIGALIAGQDAAWARGDAAGFSRAVTDDCVFTNIFGMVFVGRAAFEAQHARIFATIYKGTRVRQTIAHLRLLRPEVAAVDIDAALNGVAYAPSGLHVEGGVLRTRLLQVLVREGGDWRVASFHNVDVKPLPPLPAD